MNKIKVLSGAAALASVAVVGAVITAGPADATNTQVRPDPATAPSWYSPGPPPPQRSAPPTPQAPPPPRRVMIRVPNVVGLPELDARVTLYEQNFLIVNSVYPKTGFRPGLTIVSQNPPAGSLVPQGYPVTLYTFVFDTTR